MSFWRKREVGVAGADELGVGHRGAGRLHGGPDVQVRGAVGDARHRAGQRIVDAHHPARRDDDVAALLRCAGHAASRQPEATTAAASAAPAMRVMGPPGSAGCARSPRGPMIHSRPCPRGSVSTSAAPSPTSSWSTRPRAPSASARCSPRPRIRPTASSRASSALLGEAGVAAGAVRAVVHGTTLVTNALIERKGARTALLTTEGFRDALEIRHEGRYDMYDLFIEPPAPLVPRHLRREVAERLLADGTRAAPARRGGGAAGHRGSCVDDGRRGRRRSACCTPTSTPCHERRLAELVREIAPGLPVSCSSEVVPEIREYERTSTTTANVYVVPAHGALPRAIWSSGWREPGRARAALHHAVVRRHRAAADGAPAPDPPRRVGPGRRAPWPAAQAARERGEPRLLSFDMGGTTAKACVIDDGEPLVAREFEVARADRFKKGSGLPVRVPVIEMIEIGAGGGSIARVDASGCSRSGPTAPAPIPGRPATASAGRLPTVTDADLRARLPRRRLLPRRSHAARPRRRRGARSRSTSARPLGLDAVERRAGASTRSSTRTWRPRRASTASSAARTCGAYPLFAFGGAGPGALLAGGAHPQGPAHPAARSAPA